MKLNLSIDFESVTEMKAILMQPFPFGGFPDNLVDVEAAETAIAEVKQARAKRAKKSGTKTELAAAMEETAPVQTPAPVAAVPAAPVAVAPTAPVVEPTTEPVAAPAAVPAPTAVPTAPAAPTEPVNVAPTPVTPAPVTPVAPTAAATYTTDDLARAAVGLVDAGRQAELMSVMSKYGVVALPDLPADQYAAFAADLRALGVAI